MKIVEDLGHIKGILEGMEKQLIRINGTIDDHNNDIKDLQKKQSAIIAKLSLFAGVIGFIAAASWEFIRKKIGL